MGNKPASERLAEKQLQILEKAERDQARADRARDEETKYDPDKEKYYLGDNL